MLLPILPDPPSPIVKDFLPAKSVNIPIAWLISGVMFVISISVGYGGYRTAFQAQQAQLDGDKARIEKLEGTINTLTYEMGRLRVSVEDLKETLDRKR